MLQLFFFTSSDIRYDPFCLLPAEWRQSGCCVDYDLTFLGTTLTKESCWKQCSTLGKFCHKTVCSSLSALCVYQRWSVTQSCSGRLVTQGFRALEQVVMIRANWGSEQGPGFLVLWWGWSDEVTASARPFIRRRHLNLHICTCASTDLGAHYGPLLVSVTRSIETMSGIKSNMRNPAGRWKSAHTLLQDEIRKQGEGECPGSRDHLQLGTWDFLISCSLVLVL